MRWRRAETRSCACCTEWPSVFTVPRHSSAWRCLSWEGWLRRCRDGVSPWLWHERRKNGVRHTFSSAAAVPRRAVAEKGCLTPFFLGRGRRTAPDPDSRSDATRSEERRVGKECRSRWWPDACKKKVQTIEDMDKRREEKASESDR